MLNGKTSIILLIVGKTLLSSLLIVSVKWKDFNNPFNSWTDKKVIL